ncbi:SGNH/GDSL hydrolase family protein [Sinomonas sp. ASV486]|uniref:SGNH/GDSL hydrolase family protein n=1 Tax=Sinomonas puerhi TaxID=3238584 RepID=A0AB39L6V4_9MICC|nr:SGNH/GDSL hydrolase family protein [Sinomonas sp. ASV486]MDQ4489838.1 SGNH/GDSL hydrolase family protein [Sinomonas sp. ASV486]
MRRPENGALASGAALAVAAVLASGFLSADQDPHSQSQADRVVVVGDSLSTGYGTSARWAWPLLLSEGEQGRLNVVNASENGDGYLSIGTEGGTFGSHAAAAVTPDTSIVVFFGSENDMDEDLASITDAAVTTLQAAHETAPSARIVVVGPTAFTDDPEPERLAVRDALEAAAFQTGAEFVDPLAGKWLAASEYEGPDGDHPTVAGQEQLREEMSRALGL